jgi:hypothetical protein
MDGGLGKADYRRLKKYGGCTGLGGKCFWFIYQLAEG